MACGHFTSDWMLYLSIVVSARCLLHYPEAPTFARNSRTCRVLSALCSAWLPVLPRLWSLDQAVYTSPMPSPERPFRCRVRMLHLWEGVHSACSLCPQPVGLSGRAPPPLSPVWGWLTAPLTQTRPGYFIVIHSVFFRPPGDPPTLHACCPSHFRSLNSRFPLSWVNSAITLGSHSSAVTAGPSSWLTPSPEPEAAWCPQRLWRLTFLPAAAVARPGLGECKPSLKATVSDPNGDQCVAPPSWQLTMEKFEPEFEPPA